MSTPSDKLQGQAPETADLSLDDSIDRIADHFEVPRELWRSMVNKESGGNVNVSDSQKGASGLFQIMPGTAANLKKPNGQSINPKDPIEAAYGGLKLLSDNYRKFRPKAQNDRHAWGMAIAGYHGAPTAVERDIKRGGTGIPDQDDGGINTQDHVYKILKNAPNVGRGSQVEVAPAPAVVAPTAAAPLSKADQVRAIRAKVKPTMFTANNRAAIIRERVVNPGTSKMPTATGETEPFYVDNNTGEVVLAPGANIPLEEAQRIVAERTARQNAESDVTPYTDNVTEGYNQIDTVTGAAHSRLSQQHWASVAQAQERARQRKIEERRRQVLEARAKAEATKAPSQFKFNQSTTSLQERLGIRSDVSQTPGFNPKTGRVEVAPSKPVGMGDVRMHEGREAQAEGEMKQRLHGEMRKDAVLNVLQRRNALEGTTGATQEELEAGALNAGMGAEIDQEQTKLAQEQLSLRTRAQEALSGARPLGTWETIAETFKQNPAKLAPLLGAVVDYSNSAEANQASSRVDLGTASERDRIQLMRLQALHDESRPFAAKLASGLIEYVPFAAEFALSGGTSAPVKAGIRGALTKALPGVASKRAGEFAIKAATEIPVAATRLPYFLPRTMATYEQRVMGGEDPQSAKFYSVLDTFTEVLSEASGGAGKYIPILNRFKAPKWLAGGYKKLQSAGYHGTFNEYAEERVKDVMDMATGVRPVDEVLNGWQNPEQHLLELTQFAIPGVAMATANKVLTLKDREQSISAIRQDLDVDREDAIEVLGRLKEFQRNQAVLPSATQPAELPASETTTDTEGLRTDAIAPPAPSTPRVPEPPETLIPQFEAAMKGYGNRKALVVPAEGYTSEQIATLPEGLEWAVGPNRELAIFDPNIIPLVEVEEILARGDTHLLTGMPNRESPAATVAAIARVAEGPNKNQERLAGYLEPGTEEAFRAEATAQFPDEKLEFEFGGRETEQKILEDRSAEPEVLPVDNRMLATQELIASGEQDITTDKVTRKQEEIESRQAALNELAKPSGQIVSKSTPPGGNRAPATAAASRSAGKSSAAGVETVNPVSAPTPSVTPEVTPNEQQLNQMQNTLKWNRGKAKELSAEDAQTVLDKSIDFNRWASTKVEARLKGYAPEQTSRVAIDYLSGKLPSIPTAGGSADPYKPTTPESQAEKAVPSPKEVIEATTAKESGKVVPRNVRQEGVEYTKVKGSISRRGKADRLAAETEGGIVERDGAKGWQVMAPTSQGTVEVEDSAEPVKPIQNQVDQSREPPTPPIETRQVERAATAVEETASVEQGGRAIKIARIKELRPELEALAAKGGLTRREAVRFRELTTEVNGLRYDVVKPLDIFRIPSESERQSTLPTVLVLTANRDLVRNRTVYDRVSEAANGVFHDAETSIDKIMRGRDEDISPADLYGAFDATREAMRRHYGDKVTLYRAVGEQKTKPTTNWATTREFAQQFGRRIEKREVPIEQIIAVNVGLNGKYHEVVVGKPPTPVAKLSVRQTKTAGITARGQESEKILPSESRAAQLTPEPETALSPAEQLPNEGARPSVPSQPLTWVQFPESLGTPRSAMPQIDNAHRGAMVQFLKGRGIEWTLEEVLPTELKPSQAEYSPEKVENSRQFAKDNPDKEPRKIIVSDDSFVIDAHHQWERDLEDEPTVPIPVIRLHALASVIMLELARFPSSFTAGTHHETKTATEVRSPQSRATNQESGRKQETVPLAKTPADPGILGVEEPPQGAAAGDRAIEKQEVTEDANRQRPIPRTEGAEGREDVGVSGAQAEEEESQREPKRRAEMDGVSLQPEREQKEVTGQTDFSAIFDQAIAEATTPVEVQGEKEIKEVMPDASTEVETEPIQTTTQSGAGDVVAPASEQVIVNPKNITKKGNTVAFDKDGNAITVQYLSGSKSWVVTQQPELGTPISTRRFGTVREAAYHASIVADAAQTRSKAWWSGTEYAETPAVATALYTQLHNDPLFSRSAGSTWKLPSIGGVDRNRVSLGPGDYGIEILTDAYRRFGRYTGMPMEGVYERNSTDLAEGLEQMADEGRDGARKLAEAVKQAGAANNTVIFYSSLASLRHEIFHEAADTEQRIADLAPLIAHPAFKVLRERLLSAGYQDQASLLVEEAAAHTAAGQARFWLPEGEAADWLSLWFDFFVKTNGRASLKRFEELKNEKTKLAADIYSALSQADPAAVERDEGTNGTVRDMEGGRGRGTEGSDSGEESSFSRRIFDESTYARIRPALDTILEGMEAGLPPAEQLRTLVQTMLTEKGFPVQTVTDLKPYIVRRMEHLVNPPKPKAAAKPTDEKPAPAPPKTNRLAQTRNEFIAREDPWKELLRIAEEMQRPEGAKPLSLPKTLEAASLPRGDKLSYQGATFDQGEEIGRTLLAEKGVDGAIEYVLHGEMGIGWGPAGFAAIGAMESEIRTLESKGETEEANALQAKLDKFGGEFSERAMRNGQGMVSIKIIERFSPDRAAYELNRAKLKFRKKAATQEEKNRFTDWAIELQALTDSRNEAARELARIAEEKSRLADDLAAATEREESLKENLAYRVQVANSLEDDLAKAESRARRREKYEPSKKPAKTRSPRTYESQLDTKAEAIKDILLAKVGSFNFGNLKVEARFPGQAGKAGEDIARLPGDAELLAEYTASQLATHDTVAALNDHLISTFSSEVEPYLPAIRQRALQIRNRERAAELAARGIPPARTKTILGEIQAEATATKKAIRDLEAAHVKANKEAKQAEEKARKESEIAAAKATRERETVAERQTRQEARERAESARLNDNARRLVEINEAKRRAVEIKKEYAEARDIEEKGYRENLRERDEAARKAALWDTPLRDEAAAARARLQSATDPKDRDVLRDLVSVAIERHLPDKRSAAVRTKAVAPSAFYVELRQEFPRLVTHGSQRKIYAQAWEKIKEAEAVARAAARARTARKESDRLWDQGIDIQEQAILLRDAENAARQMEIRRKMLAELARASQSPLARFVRGITVGLNSFFRAAMSSVDLPLGRQGLLPLFTHPIMTIKGGIPAMGRGYAAYGQQAIEALDSDIRDHPRYALGKELGLDLTEVGGGDKDPLIYAEEQFGSPLASKIPHIRLSEQGYTGGMNMIRLDFLNVFATALEKNGYTLEENREDFEDAVGLVNKGTGRGNLPEFLKQAAKFSSLIFYAARFGVSHTQMMNDLFNPIKYIPARFNPAHNAIPEVPLLNDIFKSHSPPLRTQQMKHLISLGFVFAAIYGLAKLLGFDTKEFPIVKIGNSRYDFSGGKVSAVKALMKTAEAVDAAAHGRESKDLFMEAAHYGRGKLGPLASGAVDSYYGKTVVGTPANWKIQSPVKMIQENILLNRLQPIVFGDFADAYALDGWTGILKTTPALTGLSVSTYQDRGIKAIKSEAVRQQLTKLDFSSAQVFGQRTNDEVLDTAIQKVVVSRLNAFQLPSATTDLGSEALIKENLEDIKKVARSEVALAEPEKWKAYLTGKAGRNAPGFLTDEETGRLTEADIQTYTAAYADIYLRDLKNISKDPEYQKAGDSIKARRLKAMEKRAHLRARSSLRQPQVQPEAGSTRP